MVMNNGLCSTVSLRDQSNDSFSPLWMHQVEHVASSEAVAEKRGRGLVCEQGTCSLIPERQHYTLTYYKGARTQRAGIFFDL